MEDYLLVLVPEEDREKGSLVPEEDKEKGKENKERGKSSRLTSSSILLALHSPFLASLLHPGTDGLSLPFALDTIASLLAWLHGEVDSIEEEEVEEAAVWLGFQVHHHHHHQHHHQP